MDTLFTASLHTHELVVSMLIVSQFYFLLLRRKEPFVDFVKSFKKLFMVQNVLLGMVIFTGFLMLAVLKFGVWNIKIVSMIVLAVAILVHQILLNKRLKPIRSDEIELQKKFKDYATKIYVAEGIVGIVIFVVAKILR